MMMSNSKLNHEHGDNTPCDDAVRCSDYKEKYKAEVESASKPRRFVPLDYKGQYEFNKDPNETLKDTRIMQEYSVKEQNWRDYHAKYTIIFGELLDSNFDWGRNEWPCLNEEIRERLIKKIEDQYRFREICDAPPAKFKNFIVRKLNLIMPKYNELYRLIEADRVDILETSQRYDKDRDVFSEYPQSQIQGSADYASNATDKEGKGKTTGNVIQMMNDYIEKYSSIDEHIVKELEVCFYSTSSGFINAF